MTVVCRGESEFVMSAREMIAKALAAGAGVTGAPVQDAYGELRGLLCHRRGRVAEVLAELETTHAPAPAWESRLAAEDLDESPEVLAAAQRLIELTRPGSHYRVDARGAQGVQIGDGGTQHNVFRS
jgi:hypothetical protein